MADLKFGVDDNVTLENSDLAQSTNLIDNYLDLFASARYQLTGNRQKGYWALFSASSMQYRTYSTYDYTQYDLGLFRESRYGVLSTRTGVRVSQSEVGGSSYLQKYTLRVQGDYPYSNTQLLRAHYDLTRYNPTDNNYSYLEGLKGDLNIESIWRVDSGRRFRVGYNLENNSRDDYYSGNNYASYSASRHELSASVTQPVTEDLQITFGGDYRRSRYNDVNIVAGVADVRRLDRRWRWNLEGEYRVNRYLDFVVEYHFADNRSSIATRSYRRNQYLIGLQGYF